jgi:branched-chain amino acid transport system ATP-binding protein
LLAVEDLTIRYGRMVAVCGVSLRVEPGELVGLVGANGAGKSSTLQALAGGLKPAGGSILVDGEDIAGRGPQAAGERGIRLVPEGRHIFTRLTVKENLKLGATGRRDRRSVDADIEQQLVRFPALRRLIDAHAGQLSGGEQQQLAIARALMARPRLLLLDEPSLGLAPLMVDRVFDIIDALRAEGVTILLVEQLIARTMATADRAYVMQNGGISAEGRAEHLAEEFDFEAAYLGTRKVPS